MVVYVINIYFDFSGIERHTFLEMYGTPTSVTILSSDVFWTSHGSPSIEFANKFQEEPTIKRTILSECLTLQPGFI